MISLKYLIELNSCNVLIIFVLDNKQNVNRQIINILNNIHIIVEHNCVTNLFYKINDIQF